MFLDLTEDYIASKFFSYCGKPYYNRVQKTYQGSCPICREGTSWLKKRRCYYVVEKNIVCCHNCGWYSNPYNWILKITGQSYIDIKKEIETFSSPISFSNTSIREPIEQKDSEETLPEDSINLLDKGQIEYYSQNYIVKQALDLIYTRKLDTSINRCNTFYLSLTDKKQANRLILPFYDSDNKIIHYQTRTILSDDNRPKYLSKPNSEKSLFGINKVEEELEYLFITEGPIDSMFIKNGIAVAGINESRSINYTQVQKQQLNMFPLHKKIWVLDNQLVDKASKTKTKNLLDQNESVFIWPESMKSYKDINEYCIDNNTTNLDIDFILKNTYNGLKGRMILANY